MTRSTPSRKARRQAHKAAKIVANRTSAAEAREKLARWAAAGGDMAYLQKTGEVRMRGELKPLKLNTLADMKARYASDQQETAEEAATAAKGPLL